MLRMVKHDVMLWLRGSITIILVFPAHLLIVYMAPLMNELLALVILLFAVTSPPRITRQPAQEIAYKTEERVELPCVAAGEPRPTYVWRTKRQERESRGREVER